MLYNEQTSMPLYYYRQKLEDVNLSQLGIEESLKQRKKSQALLHQWLCHVLYYCVYFRYRRSSDDFWFGSLSHYIDIIHWQSLLWVVCTLLYIPGMILRQRNTRTICMKLLNSHNALIDYIVFCFLAFAFFRGTRRDPFRFTNFGKVFLLFCRFLPKLSA